MITFYMLDCKKILKYSPSSYKMGVSILLMEYLMIHIEVKTTWFHRVVRWG